MTTLDFFIQKLQLDVTRKIIFFSEEDKQTIKNGNEVVRFSNGTFTVERRRSYAIK